MDRLLSSLQPRLLKNTVERSDWHVNSELTGDRDGARLYRMLELPVATLRPDVTPAIIFDQLNHIANLHAVAA
jgi:hypothetical protein